MLLASLRLVVLLGLAQGPPDSLVARIFAAEQDRARSPAELVWLAEATRHSDTTVQRLAVRAIGRLERPDQLGILTGALAAPAATVRAEAANAMAQAVYRTDGDSALTLLARRLDAERDDAARGALLAAIGRLRLGGPDLRTAQELLTRELLAGAGNVGGALRGTWDLLRRQGRSASVGGPLAAELRRRLGVATHAEDRRLALMALSAGNAVDSAVVAVAMEDADPQVRRLAVLAARSGRGTAGRTRVFRLALHDPAVMVRVEAVRGWAAHGRTTEGCEPLIAAVRDSSVTIQLLAIDALGAGCGPMEAPRDLLESISREPLVPGAWHRPVHALAALASADSVRAELRLGAFVTSPIWWVRMHAAAVAGQLRDRTQLEHLVADSVDNVREAALRALVAVDGHGADPDALRQLGRPDNQLVLTAARALKGSALGAEVAAASLAALDRVTASGQQTARDTRLALLDRIEEFGGAPVVGALEPLLGDHDVAVAERAATVMSTIAGRPFVASAREPAPPPLPPISVLRGLTSATIVLLDGTRWDLELFPMEAPGSVTRFVAMARDGWFNGLTLHRVVPNFVLQGGSPGANEYAGAAAFGRDEVGGRHVRGTVGISTRGRDTGDGQLFFNLVDNLNLDHEYTVIGKVRSVPGSLDQIQEGAVIQRIEVPGDRR